MNLKTTTRALAATLLLACAQGAAGADIIPLPSSMSQSESSFTFPARTTYKLPQFEGDSVAMVFNTLSGAIAKGAGSELVAGKEKADIELAVNPAMGPEAYALKVSPGGIVIEAARPAGFFYALQSLRQMLPVNPASPATIQAVEIEDSPRFGWRGFMLDEGRHIFGKDEVKKVLDMMAMYKLNRFHWHLTEDQGWRIEIKKYPKLTEVGATRGSKSLGWQAYEPDTVTYSGYYTQDDIREIVAYAKDRFIEVVPEIDIPGHTQAAVAAYPEILACDPENEHEVWLYQGVSRDVMNVANPAAVQMAKDIIDELIPLFPYSYIHLGGDECPTTKWEQNDACKALLAEIGSDNYRDLQLDFYRKLAKHIADKPQADHRKLIFWNEVLHGNTAMLPQDMTIMAWVGADKAALEAAQRGLTTILTPQIPYYINRKQNPSPTEPLSQGRGTETLEAVYNYVPMKDVPAELADKYMGVQANFWSEYVITPEFLEYLMMPRLAAVAEAGWTPQEKRDYSDFHKRIRTHEPIYQSLDWNYGRHAFAKEASDCCQKPQECDK
ncbi:MAG: beta-N-acetylhexosaminidase [Muribaculaceae bacterium]|nr:beta-N-acetylhexosaminidase [Muribaculaceae bacterium]